MNKLKNIEANIERKRQELNKMHPNTVNALKVSQELDKWIVEYYKNK